MAEPFTIDPAELDTDAYKCTYIRHAGSDWQENEYQCWLFRAKEKRTDGSLGDSFYGHVWMTDELMAERGAAVDMLRRSIGKELQYLQEERAEAKPETT